VGGFHWLTERQFLDAVAIAMITPGPVVITSGFIGYLVAGPLRAFAATLAVFLPPKESRRQRWELLPAQPSF
jgi:chromate transporter